MNTNESKLHAFAQKNRYILIGWAVILLFTMLVYNALLFSSLKKEVENSRLASARIMADNLALDIQSGLRFGKKLNNFNGLDLLLQTRSQYMPLAVFAADASLIQKTDHFPTLEKEHANFFGNEIQTASDRFLRKTNSGSVLFLPLMQDNNTAGYLAVFIDNDAMLSELYAFYGKQLGLQGAIGLAGILCLAVLLRLLEKRTEKTGTPLEKALRHTRFCGIFTFLAVLLLNGALMIYNSNGRYVETLKADSEKTFTFMSKTLNKLLLVGIAFENMDNTNAYLTNITETHRNIILLKIYDENNTLTAKSQNHAEKSLANPLTFPVKLHTLQTDDNTAQAERDWTLTVSVNYQSWLGYLRAITLDMLTIVVISVIFMTELFLLLIRGIDYIQSKNNRIQEPCTELLQNSGQYSEGSGVSRTVLMRPLMFFVFFAINQSISFIPLRMSELLSAQNIQNTVLAGLPVSAEMGMTGLSALIAGTWIKKKGIKLPFMSGLCLLGMGYFCSMLAVSPWQFIAARAIVGTGYGLTLLTAQAFTVKDGMLADMFAGAYAGMLCGSALGAMIAERLDFTSVFLISAVILLCFLPVSRLILKEENTAQAITETEKQEKSAAETEKSNSLPLKKILPLLWDKQFLSFILCNHIPFAMLCVGFLNFFLPVYLKSAGTAQSDIGRIFMLNCLLVVYSGPVFSSFVIKLTRKNNMVAAVGVLSACALFALSLLPPLPGSLLGAVLLGTAVGLSISAQSEYFLELEICKKLGVDQSMSLLDVLQRVGQVLGPLCAGIALQTMNIDAVTKQIGLAFVCISVLFLFLTRRRRPQAAQ